MTARAIFHQSWRIYQDNFLVIFAIVALIWIPLELLSSYMDAFVFGPDDWRRSFRFSRLLNNTFGLFATAGVIHIALQPLTTNTVTFPSVLQIAVRSWPRMFWTCIVWSLVIFGGILLLVIPGIYFGVRLCIIQQVTMHERVSGSEAVRRSCALTQGRFWLLFRLSLIICVPFIVVITLLFLPYTFLSGFDYWIAEAVTAFICDLLGAFITIAFTVIYLQLKAEELKPAVQPPPLPVRAPETPATI